jgi:hypothetical protein
MFRYFDPAACSSTCCTCPSSSVTIITGPVRLCVGVKLQGLHRARSLQLDRGSNQALCCKEEEDLQGVVYNRGSQLAFHLVGASLVKLP